MRKWLFDIRTQHNLTHEEIATKCSITRQYYSMIENGERRPSVDTAKAISEFLGFDWTLFFSNCEKNSA